MLYEAERIFIGGWTPSSHLRVTSRAACLPRGKIRSDITESDASSRSPFSKNSRSIIARDPGRIFIEARAIDRDEEGARFSGHLVYCVASLQRAHASSRLYPSELDVNGANLQLRAGAIIHKLSQRRARSRCR